MFRIPSVILLPVWFLVLLPFSRAVAQEAMPVSIPLARILSTLSFDWDKDGEPDHALLVEGEPDADLFLRWGRDGQLVLREFAWSGGMMRRPRLSLNESGSLIVTAANDAVGRNRWESRVTIAFRDGRFIVAGYDYKGYDTLREVEDVDFSVNYLTGKSIRNGKETKCEPRIIPIEEWEAPSVQ